ncbi:MAG: PstS family phosphate ABC transporter substrate-binding protein [Spartobacteria bacterium]|nr:PstS family phosphate ABC transporter substrate-binding protein [Spartobacteria bacterium]
MRKLILGLAAAALLTVQANAETKIVCEGSSTVGPLAKAFAEYFMKNNPDVSVSVSESGSGNGAKAIINGTCDVADMSRGMKAKEFKACADKGIMPTPHVVALDGIAVVVHKSNPVKGLSLEQIRDIYTGKIKNWKDVGGVDMPIVVITRDTNSGTFETFENLVMSKQKMSDSCEVVGSNGQAKSRVESTPSAVAFVGLGFVEGVKAIDVNGIEANLETIQAGTYPIARPLFMYTNGSPKMGTPLYRFITLYLTEPGQEMVEEIGFIPVTSY